MAKLSDEEIARQREALLAEAAFVLDGDVVAPRDKANRYRVYRVKDGGRPELVATCRTQGSIGTAICTLGAEDEFLNYCVGILDALDHKNAKGEWVGKWLVLPWQEKENTDDEEGEGGADAP